MDSSRGSVRLFVKGSYACRVEFVSSSHAIKALDILSNINLKWKIDIKDAETRYFQNISTLPQGSETYSQGWYYNVYEMRASGCSFGLEKLWTCLNNQVAVVNVGERGHFLLMEDNLITQRLGIRPLHDPDHYRLHCIHVSKDPSQWRGLLGDTETDFQHTDCIRMGANSDPFVENFLHWPPDSSLLSSENVSESLMKLHKACTLSDGSSSCARIDHQYVDKKLVKEGGSDKGKHNGIARKSERSENEAENRTLPEKKRHKSLVDMEVNSPQACGGEGKTTHPPGMDAVQSEEKPLLSTSKRSEKSKTEHKKSKHLDKHKNTSKASKPATVLNKQQSVDKVISSMFSGLGKEIGRIPKKSKPSENKICSAEKHATSSHDGTKKISANEPEVKFTKFQHKDEKAEISNHNSHKSDINEKHASHKTKYKYDKEKAKKSKHGKENSKITTEKFNLGLDNVTERDNDCEILESVGNGWCVKEMVRDALLGSGKSCLKSDKGGESTGDSDEMKYSKTKEIVIPGLGDLDEFNRLMDTERMATSGFVKRSTRVTDDDLEVSLPGTINKTRHSDMTSDLQGLVLMVLFGNQLSIPMTEANSQLHECILSIHDHSQRWHKSVTKKIVLERNKLSYVVTLVKPEQAENKGNAPDSSVKDSGNRAKRNNRDCFDNVTNKLISIVQRKKSTDWTYPDPCIASKGVTQKLIIPELTAADLSSDDELADINRNPSVMNNISRGGYSGTEIKNTVDDDSDVRKVTSNGHYKAKSIESRTSGDGKISNKSDGKDNERSNDRNSQKNKSLNKTGDKDVTLHRSRRSQSKKRSRSHSRERRKRSQSRDKSRRNLLTERSRRSQFMKEMSKCSDKRRRSKSRSKSRKSTSKERSNHSKDRRKNSEENEHRPKTHFSCYMDNEKEIFWNKHESKMKTRSKSKSRTSKSASEERSNDKDDRSTNGEEIDDRAKTPSSCYLASDKDIISNSREKANSKHQSSVSSDPDKMTGRTEKRHERQFHPYKKDDRPSRRHIPHWSFDLAYSDMNQLLLNMTLNSFKKQSNRPAEVGGRNNSLGRRSYGNRGRFHHYRFIRSEVGCTPPRETCYSSEEDDVVHPGEIPDLKERAKQADVLENFMGIGQDEKEYSTEMLIYEKESKDNQKRVTQTDSKLKSAVVIPGGPKTSVFSGLNLDEPSEEPDELAFNENARTNENDYQTFLSNTPKDVTSATDENGAVQENLMNENESPEKNEKGSEDKKKNEETYKRLSVENGIEKEKVFVSISFSSDIGNEENRARQSAENENRKILSSDSDVCLDWNDEDVALDKKEENVFEDDETHLSDSESVLTVVDECTQTPEKPTSDSSELDDTLMDHFKTIDFVGESDTSPNKFCGHVEEFNTVVPNSEKCAVILTIEEDENETHADGRTSADNEKSKLSELMTFDSVFPAFDEHNSSSHTTKNIEGKSNVQGNATKKLDPNTDAEIKHRKQLLTKNIWSGSEELLALGKCDMMKETTDKELNMCEKMNVTQTTECEQNGRLENDKGIDDHVVKISSEILKESIIHQEKEDSLITFKVDEKHTKMVGETDGNGPHIVDRDEQRVSHLVEEKESIIDDQLGLKVAVEQMNESCISVVHFTKVAGKTFTCQNIPDQAEVVELDKAGDKVNANVDEDYSHCNNSSQDETTLKVKSSSDTTILPLEITPLQSQEYNEADVNIDPVNFGKDEYLYVDENVIIGKTEEDFAKINKEMSAVDYRRKEKFVAQYETYMDCPEDGSANGLEGVPELEEFDIIPDIAAFKPLLDNGYQRLNALKRQNAKGVEQTFESEICSYVNEECNDSTTTVTSNQTTSIHKNLSDTINSSKSNVIDDILEGEGYHATHRQEAEEGVVFENYGILEKTEENAIHNERSEISKGMYPVVLSTCKSNDGGSVTIKRTASADSAEQEQLSDGSTSPKPQTNLLTEDLCLNTDLKVVPTSGSNCTVSKSLTGAVGKVVGTLDEEQENTSSTWAYPLSETENEEGTEKRNTFISELEDEAVFHISDTIDEGTDETSFEVKKYADSVDDESNNTIGEPYTSDALERMMPNTQVKQAGVDQKTIQQGVHSAGSTFQHRSYSPFNHASNSPFIHSPANYFHRPWFRHQNIWSTVPLWHRFRSPNAAQQYGMYTPHGGWHFPVINHGLSLQPSLPSFNWNRTSPHTAQNYGTHSPSLGHGYLGDRRSTPEQTSVHQNGNDSAVSMAPWIISTDNMSPFIQNNNTDTYFIRDHAFGQNVKEVCALEKNESLLKQSNGNIKKIARNVDGTTSLVRDIPVREIPLPKSSPPSNLTCLKIRVPDTPVVNDMCKESVKTGTKIDNPRNKTNCVFEPKKISENLSNESNPANVGQRGDIVNRHEKNTPQVYNPKLLKELSSEILEALHSPSGVCFQTMRNNKMSHESAVEDNKKAECQNTTSLNNNSNFNMTRGPLGKFEAHKLKGFKEETVIAHKDINDKVCTQYTEIKTKGKERNENVLNGISFDNKPGKVPMKRANVGDVEVFGGSSNEVLGRRIPFGVGHILSVLNETLQKSQKSKLETFKVSKTAKPTSYIGKQQIMSRRKSAVSKSHTENENFAYNERHVMCNSGADKYRNGDAFQTGNASFRSRDINVFGKLDFSSNEDLSRNYFDEKYTQRQSPKALKPALWLDDENFNARRITELATKVKKKTESVLKERVRIKTPETKIKNLEINKTGFNSDVGNEAAVRIDGDCYQSTGTYDGYVDSSKLEFSTRNQQCHTESLTQQTLVATENVKHAIPIGNFRKKSHEYSKAKKSHAENIDVDISKDIGTDGASAAHADTDCYKQIGTKSAKLSAQNGQLEVKQQALNCNKLLSDNQNLDHNQTNLKSEDVEFKASSVKTDSGCSDDNRNLFLKSGDAYSAKQLSGVGHVLNLLQQTFKTTPQSECDHLISTHIGHGKKQRVKLDNGNSNKHRKGHKEEICIVGSGTSYQDRADKDNVEFDYSREANVLNEKIITYGNNTNSNRTENGALYEEQVKSLIAHEGIQLNDLDTDSNMMSVKDSSNLEFNKKEAMRNGHLTQDSKQDKVKTRQVYNSVGHALNILNTTNERLVRTSSEKTANENSCNSTKEKGNIHSVATLPKGEASVKETCKECMSSENSKKGGKLEDFISTDAFDTELQSFYHEIYCKDDILTDLARSAVNLDDSEMTPTGETVPRSIFPFNMEASVPRNTCDGESDVTYDKISIQTVCDEPFAENKDIKTAAVHFGMVNERRESLHGNFSDKENENSTQQYQQTEHLNEETSLVADNEHTKTDKQTLSFSETSGSKRCNLNVPSNNSKTKRTIKDYDTPLFDTKLKNFEKLNDSQVLLEGKDEKAQESVPVEVGRCDNIKKMYEKCDNIKKVNESSYNLDTQDFSTKLNETSLQHRHARNICFRIKPSTKLVTQSLFGTRSCFAEMNSLTSRQNSRYINECLHASRLASLDCFRAEKEKENKKAYTQDWVNQASEQMQMNWRPETQTDQNYITQNESGLKELNKKPSLSKHDASSIDDNSSFSEYSCDTESSCRSGNIQKTYQYKGRVYRKYVTRSNSVSSLSTNRKKSITKETKLGKIHARFQNKNTLPKQYRYRSCSSESMSSSIDSTDESLKNKNVVYLRNKSKRNRSFSLSSSNRSVCSMDRKHQSIYPKASGSTFERRTGKFRSCRKRKRFSSDSSVNTCSDERHKSSQSHSRIRKSRSSLQIHSSRNSPSSTQSSTSTSVSSRGCRNHQKGNANRNRSRRTSSEGLFPRISRSGEKYGSKCTVKKYFDKKGKIRGFQHDSSAHYKLRNVFPGAASYISSKLSSGSEGSSGSVEGSESFLTDDESNSKCNETVLSPLAHDKMTDGMKHILIEYAEDKIVKADEQSQIHQDDSRRRLKLKTVFIKPGVMKKLKIDGMRKFLQALDEFSSDKCSWMLSVLHSDALQIDVRFSENLKKLEEQHENLHIISDATCLDTLLLRELGNPDVLEIFVIIEPPDRDQNIRSVIQYCSMKTFLDSHLTSSLEATLLQ